MTRLTRQTVRIRAIESVLLIGVTFALVILGLVYFSSSAWFWVLAIFIDVPIWILIAFLERLDRSAS